MCHFSRATFSWLAIGVTGAMCPATAWSAEVTSVSIFLENAGNHLGSPSVLVSAHAVPTAPGTRVTWVTAERISNDGGGPWIQPLTPRGGTSWSEWHYSMGGPIGRDEDLSFRIVAEDDAGLRSTQPDVRIGAGYDLGTIDDFGVSLQASGDYRVMFDEIPGTKEYDLWLWGGRGVPAGQATILGRATTVESLASIPMALLEPGQSYGITAFAYRDFHYRWGDQMLTGSYRRYESITLTVPIPEPGLASGMMAMACGLASGRPRRARGCRYAGVK